MVDHNYSTDYQDVYFSTQGGLAESSLVFVEGNRLVERLTADPAPGGIPFLLGELGFGSGLNLVALLHALADRVHQPFVWYSVDETWLDLGARRSLLSLFPQASKAVEAFLGALGSSVVLPCTGGRLHEFSGKGWTGKVLEGDVGQLGRVLPQALDAWILDGHSPDKNPAMWSGEVFTMMAQRSKPGLTSLATYSSAGLVKRGLRSAGFSVLRRKGFGQKRHRLEGIFNGRAEEEDC